MSSVVVVGDVLLDVDVHGEVERLCPDAPVPVLDVTGEVARPGGAGLAAALLAGSGVRTTLVAALAEDGERVRGLLAPTLDLITGPATGGTPVKCRWHSGEGPLLRTDTGSGRPADEFGETVRTALSRVLDGAGAVLVSDYGRGVTADPQVRRMLSGAVAAGTPVVWDPHPKGSDPVPGVIMTPNAEEAAGALGLPGGDAVGCAAELRRRRESHAVVVTRGDRGAVLVTASDRVAVPALDVTGGDPCGAGDAFAGRLAAALAGGASLRAAVERAVEAAGRFVEAGGAATVRCIDGRWTQVSPANVSERAS
ncbi:PfkB family carbohydrate kinase [Pseudonocardia sp. NPDC049154]|uniref:PfkB family carbohydrate kinase n=1 Tax=Pseudonocardia sp. NPDC049154 TaxID=3155501 RepID=UPI0033DB2140